MSVVTRVSAVFKRELRGYFATPLAYIFLAVFTLLSGLLTFEVGSFFSREQADLMSFFTFHPWLYLVLMPPLAMRLWAEERQTGTIELLMTLPLTTFDAVLGKFFAAWFFVACALVTTTPIWFTVNYLGDPDNGIILAAYVGSWLMGGSFLALGSFMSSLSSNQVIAFVLSIIVSFGFLLLGFGPVAAAIQEVFPELLANILVSMSFMTHFQAISRGVLDINDVGFFLMFIVCWLLATVAFVDWKRAE